MRGKIWMSKYLLPLVMDMERSLRGNLSIVSKMLSTSKRTTSTQTGEVTIFFTCRKGYSQRINLLAENLNDLLTQAQARAKDVGFDIPSGKFLEIIQADTEDLTPEQLWSKICQDGHISLGYH